MKKRPLEIPSEDIRYRYTELKSVKGEVVGFVCVKCGRLHTAPHRDNCEWAFAVEKTSSMEELLKENDRLKREYGQVSAALGPECKMARMDGVWEAAKGSTASTDAEVFLDGVAKLLAENERLRTSLEEIAKWPLLHPPGEQLWVNKTKELLKENERLKDLLRYEGSEGMQRLLRERDALRAALETIAGAKWSGEYNIAIARDALNAAKERTK